MLSRREVVTGGLMGTMAGAVDGTGTVEQPEATLAVGLRSLDTNMKDVVSALERGLVGPSLSSGGYIGKIRDQYRVWLKSTGHFPEFMEIGIAPFYEVYDWHVRNTQQIQIFRAAENRMAIQFMFTQLILRWEQDDRYIGQPYDAK